MTKKIAAIIYHAGCWDGLASAWATREGINRTLKEEYDVVTIPAKYGQRAPVVNQTDQLYIVDFSYDRETLLDLKEQVEEIVVLDHHTTAHEALKGLDFCVFDMEKSGARLAWDHFFPEKEPPGWLLYIEDRDLWKWELNNTEEFTTWLFSKPLVLETLDKVHAEECTHPGLEFYDLAIQQGRSMLEFRDQLVQRIVKDAVPAKLGDHTVYTVNTCVLCSEVGNAIADMYDACAAVYYHCGDGTVKFSLRSKGDLDVSEIAKLFGGGGHKNAAGFVLPEEKAASLFKTAVIKP